MKELNKGIKELIRLVAEYPTLEVVAGCDATNMEIVKENFIPQGKRKDNKQVKED